MIVNFGQGMTAEELGFETGEKVLCEQDSRATPEKQSSSKKKTPGEGWVLF
jgi:hypothetical protein